MVRVWGSLWSVSIHCRVRTSKWKDAFCRLGCDPPPSLQGAHRPHVCIKMLNLKNKIKQKKTYYCLILTKKKKMRRFLLRAKGSYKLSRVYWNSMKDSKQKRLKTRCLQQGGQPRPQSRASPQDGACSHQQRAPRTCVPSRQQVKRTLFILKRWGTGPWGPHPRAGCFSVLQAGQVSLV